MTRSPSVRPSSTSTLIPSLRPRLDLAFLGLVGPQANRHERAPLLEPDHAPGIIRMSERRSMITWALAE